MIKNQGFILDCLDIHANIKELISDSDFLWIGTEFMSFFEIFFRIYLFGYSGFLGLYCVGFRRFFWVVLDWIHKLSLGCIWFDSGGFPWVEFMMFFG